MAKYAYIIRVKIDGERQALVGYPPLTDRFGDIYEGPGNAPLLLEECETLADEFEVPLADITVHVPAGKARYSLAEARKAGLGAACSTTMGER